MQWECVRENSLGYIVDRVFSSSIKKSVREYIITERIPQSSFSIAFRYIPLLRISVSCLFYYTRSRRVHSNYHSGLRSTWRILAFPYYASCVFFFARAYWVDYGYLCDYGWYVFSLWAILSILERILMFLIFVIENKNWKIYIWKAEYFNEP